MFAFNQHLCPKAVDLLAGMGGQLPPASADQVTPQITAHPVIGEALKPLKSVGGSGRLNEPANIPDQGRFLPTDAQPLQAVENCARSSLDDLCRASGIPRVFTISEYAATLLTNQRVGEWAIIHPSSRGYPAR